MENKYDLAGKVIGLAMIIHTALGPGFLEAVYRNALAYELRSLYTIGSRSLEILWQI